MQELGNPALLLGFRLQRVEMLRHEIADTYHRLDLLCRHPIGVEDAQQRL
jgi:hypothetical protein